MALYEGLPREIIALRISKEIKDNTYVNLGIGIPTLISNWIEDRNIILQSEIGMLKTGPMAESDQADLDMINASCQPITEVPGSVYFDICDSFAMIRGGHIDVTVMGAYQVSEFGDFASWSNPDRKLDGIGNIGGSMDLAAGAKKLYIAMEHTTKDGVPKIKRELTYPVTARRKVELIFTDLSVIAVTANGLVLKEIYPDITIDELQAITEPKLIVSPDLKEIEL